MQPPAVTDRADALAERAGIAPRYAIEWLEQQAVAGLLETDGAPERRYRLDPAHARVLVDPDDRAPVAPFAHMLAGIGGVLPRGVDAYRSGGGVPYHAYGAAFRHGHGHIHGPAFSHQLPAEWLRAMPDVIARLESARHPRIADLGCGQGFATLALANAFLDAHIDGVVADTFTAPPARSSESAMAGASPTACPHGWPRNPPPFPARC